MDTSWLKEKKTQLKTINYNVNNSLFSNFFKDFVKSSFSISHQVQKHFYEPYKYEKKEDKILLILSSSLL